MPTLPASGYPVPVAPSVQPADAPFTPYQTDRGATLDAFGGGSGEALTRLGGQFAQAAESFERIQAFHDTIAADAKISEFEGSVNKLLYGDPDTPGDVGYLGLQGEKALHARAPTRQRIDKLLQEYRAVLQNPRQQLAFDTQTRRYRNSVLESVGRHYDRQFNIYGTEVTKARIDTSAANAQIASNRGDVAAFQEALGDTLLQAEKLRGLGHSAEYVEGVKREKTKELAVGWARSLAVKDPVAADAFADANKDHLGDQYDNVKNAVRAEAKKAQATEIFTGTKAPKGASNLIRGGAAQKAVSDEATKQGVSNRLALTTASIESNFGAAPDRPGSQYQGVFQLSDDWGRRVGGKGIPQGISALRIVKQELTEKLGREPEDWEVYLAHNQGVAGATALLSNPDLSAGQAVTQAGGKPANISSNFGGNPSEPARVFTARVRQKFNDTASQIVPAVPEAVPQGTAAQREAFFAHNKANPTATVSWEEFLAKEAPTAKPVDTLLSNLPEREPGQLPDAELGTAYREQLEAMAKRVPPGTPIDVWHQAVRMARQRYNDAWTLQRRNEQAQAAANKAADEALKREYDQRIAKGEALTGAQILADTRWKDSEAARATVAFMDRQTKADPPKGVSDRNERLLHARMTAPDDSPDKIFGEKTINEAWYNQEIDEPAHRRLIARLRDVQDPAKQRLLARRDDFIEAMLPRIFPFAAMVGKGDRTKAILQDPVGAKRLYDAEWYIDEQIKNAGENNKNPVNLFNPKSPEYLGNALPPELLAPVTESLPRPMGGKAPPTREQVSQALVDPKLDANAKRAMLADAMRSGLLSKTEAADLGVKHGLLKLNLPTVPVR